MQELIKRIYVNGKKRTIRLYAHEPCPPDAFIPSDDKLALLFKIPITKKESEQEKHILRRDFAPFIENPNHTKCKPEYSTYQIGTKHYFFVVYHVYDYEYGKELFNRLKEKYFS